MMQEKEMGEQKMEGMMQWLKDLPEDKRNAFIRAKLDYKLKKVQAKMDFLKELQMIFR